MGSLINDNFKEENRFCNQHNISFTTEELRDALQQQVRNNFALHQKVAFLLQRQVKGQEAAVSHQREEDAFLWQEVADLQHRVAYLEG